MKLGLHEIPESRLVPNCVTDIKKIYDTVKFEQIASKDLAKLLGYTFATSGRFYLRLKSLITYGLLQSGNSVTPLGYEISYPESPEQEDRARKKAIFNVTLWRELYKQVGKNPPAEFWIPLKTAAGVDAPSAQKNAPIIKKWYLEDIGLVPDDVLKESIYGESAETKGLSSNNDNSTPVSQQLVRNEIEPNSLGRLIVKGIGDFDLTDADTIDLAESALKILRKKLAPKLEE
jgi:hypothetical protein